MGLQLYMIYKGVGTWDIYGTLVIYELQAWRDM